MQHLIRIYLHCVQFYLYNLVIFTYKQKYGEPSLTFWIQIGWAKKASDKHLLRDNEKIVIVVATEHLDRV